MRESYAILITEEALRDLEAIEDTGIRRSIRQKIAQLRHNPQAQGKPLGAALRGHFRIKVRRRWRIIYRVAVLEGQVVVVMIGIRKEGDQSDIYRRAGKRKG